MTNSKITTRDVNFWHGSFHALKNISPQSIFEKIGCIYRTSGCRKSTFLRLLNQMNDDLIPIPACQVRVLIDNQNIYEKGIEVDELRKK